MKRKIVRFFGLIFAQLCIPWKRKVDIIELRDLINYPNHIILTKTKWCLTNLFIRGRYKHAGIITKDCLHVIEATTHGSRLTEIEVFLSNKSKYKVFRMAGMSQHEKDMVETMLYGYVGRPYDWLFFWEDASLYCSELVATIYNRARPDFFKITDRIIEPSELLRADIEVVYEFNQ